MAIQVPTVLSLHRDRQSHEELDETEVVAPHIKCAETSSICSVPQGPGTDHVAMQQPSTTCEFTPLYGTVLCFVQFLVLCSVGPRLLYPVLCLVRYFAAITTIAQYVHPIPASVLRQKNKKQLDRNRIRPLFAPVRGSARRNSSFINTRLLPVVYMTGDHSFSA